MTDDYDLQAGGPSLSLDEVISRYGMNRMSKEYDLDGPSIIVVGPDGVGKTTIVKQISKLLNIPSFKCPSEKRIFREGGRSSLAFDYTLTHFLEQTGFRFVSDRGYPCEWAYSSVFERETDMDLLELIDAGHANIGTRILYLYSSIPPFEPDDIVPSDKFSDIQATYDEFANWTSCQITAMNTAKMLTEYHVNGRDTAEQVAIEAIQRMDLSFSHQYVGDGNWYSCLDCHIGASNDSAKTPCVKRTFK